MFSNPVQLWVVIHPAWRLLLTLSPICIPTNMQKQLNALGLFAVLMPIRLEGLAQPLTIPHKQENKFCFSRLHCKHSGDTRDRFQGKQHLKNKWVTNSELQDQICLSEGQYFFTPLCCFFSPREAYKKQTGFTKLHYKICLPFASIRDIMCYLCSHLG